MIYTEFDRDSTGTIIGKLAESGDWQTITDDNELDDLLKELDDYVVLLQYRVRVAPDDDEMTYEKEPEINPDR